MPKPGSFVIKLTPVPHKGPAPKPAPVPKPAPPLPPAKPVVTVAFCVVSPQIGTADAGRIVQALNMQVPDLQEHWPVAVEYEAILVPDLHSVPAGAIPAYFLQDSDQAGALAYHGTDPLGRPYIRVFTAPFLSNGGTVLTGPNSIASGASHEFCETWGDPGCELVVTDPQGRSWAKELCDQVEASSYDKRLTDGSTVSVSNFVLPPVWGEGSGQMDYVGVLSQPWTIMHDGYAVIDANDGRGPQPVFGDRYPAWRRDMKLTTPVSRTLRRVHRVRG